MASWGSSQTGFLHKWPNKCSRRLFQDFFKTSSDTVLLTWKCLVSSKLLPTNWLGEWFYWKSECDTQVKQYQCLGEWWTALCQGEWSLASKAVREFQAAMNPQHRAELTVSESQWSGGRCRCTTSSLSVMSPNIMKWCRQCLTCNALSFQQHGTPDL
jgi:hypothetical protein